MTSWTREEILAPITRWTAGRKLMLLRAVRRRIVSVEDIMPAHGISKEEWEIWSAGLDVLGVDALRAKNTTIRERDVVRGQG